MKSAILAKLLLMLMLALPAFQVQAQIQSRISGTIDTIMQDDGYIIIDGKKMIFHPSQVVITYKGQQVRSSFLTSGLTVRYSTRADGSVSELTLIGPASELEQIYNQ